jgi:hypothetical protein
MNDQDSSPKKHKTRNQRKRITIRRRRRRENSKEAEAILIWEQKLAKFLEENSEPEFPKLHTLTYYEKINGKRQKVILYTHGRGYYVYAYFNKTFDFVYVTPDGQAAFLPNDEQPNATIEKILQFARQFGINSLPVHPKYDPPQVEPKPRLIKATNRAVE